MFAPVAGATLSAFYLALVRSYDVIPETSTIPASPAVRDMEGIVPFDRMEQIRLPATLPALAFLPSVELVAKLGIVFSASDGPAVFGALY